MQAKEKTPKNVQPIIELPGARLERMYIEEYLRGKGLTWKGLRKLSPAEANKIMIEASIYASLKLAEVETRAHMVRHLHGEK